MILPAERSREHTPLRLLTIPTLFVVVPSLIALTRIRTEESELLYFVVTRPMVPTLIGLWLLCGRRVLTLLRPEDAALAKKVGARSDSDVTVASYVGLFVPFVVVCGLSAICAVVNASIGTQEEVLVSGTVQRVDFGRWTRGHRVTVRMGAGGRDVTLPIDSKAAFRLSSGGPFAERYRRGGLGLLYLP